MVLISIIVPVYNAGKYLKECIESLINQTYKDIEIICINDGSTDNSLNILEKYAQKDNRIKIYSQENKGESETRNLGLKLAKGKYIMALDADDKCSLDTIETSLKIAEKKQLDIVINFLNVRLNLDKRMPSEISYTTVWQVFYKKKLLENNPDITYNKNLQMGPDAVFTHKLLGLTSKIGINKESKYFYRRHNLQISKRIEHQPDKLLDNIRIWFEDLCDFYTKRDWWESHNDHFINYLCEQPFTSYLRANWNNEQKEELFNLIHNTVKKYNLKIHFTYSNNRVNLFKKFIACNTYKEFELYRFVSYWYFKYVDLKKIYFTKTDVL